MMSSARTLRAILLAFTTCAAAPPSARADVAPPPRFDRTCDLRHAKGDGEACSTCDVDFRDADVCARTLGAGGSTRRCRTAGVVAWTEVWCRWPPATSSDAPPASASSPAASTAPPSSAPPAPSAAPPPAARCAVSPSAAPSSALAPLLVMLAVGAAARARRALRGARRTSRL